MSNRQRFADILARRSDHCGFWHGNPNPASVDKIFSHFGVEDDFQLGLKLGSTCRWVMPPWSPPLESSLNPVPNPIKPLCSRARWPAPDLFGQSLPSRWPGGPTGTPIFTVVVFFVFCFFFCQRQHEQ